MIILSVHRKVSTQHTDSADVRMTFFRMLNRIMYTLRVNYLVPY